VIESPKKSFDTKFEVRSIPKQKKSGGSLSYHYFWLMMIKFIIEERTTQWLRFRTSIRTEIEWLSCTKTLVGKCFGYMKNLFVICVSDRHVFRSDSFHISNQKVLTKFWSVKLLAVRLVFLSDCVQIDRKMTWENNEL